MSMSHSEISMTVVEKLSLWSWYESFNREEITRARDHDHVHSRRSHLAWRPHISHQMVQLLDRGPTGAGTGRALDRLDSPLLSCSACVRRWHSLQRSSLARQVTTQMADRLTNRSYPSSVSGVRSLSLATPEPPGGPGYLAVSQVAARVWRILVRVDLECQRQAVTQRMTEK